MLRKHPPEIVESWLQVVEEILEQPMLPSVYHSLCSQLAMVQTVAVHQGSDGLEWLSWSPRIPMGFFVSTERRRRKREDSSASLLHLISDDWCLVVDMAAAEGV